MNRALRSTALAKMEANYDRFQGSEKKWMLKADSHRKIIKDYRPKTGKDQEILSESGGNPLKIVLKLQFTNDF